MGLVRILMLLVGTMLSGCATMMTSELAAPDDEGTVREYKYGIYDARAAWTNDDGFVVVCIVGEVLRQENAPYSLVLRTTANGLPHGQISRDKTDQEALPEYGVAPREIGEPCEYAPAGRSIPLITLELSEPEYYEHTPSKLPELLNLLESQEKPPALAVIKLNRAKYCAEVIIWNPSADTPDIEFVRISTPTAEQTIAGNRAWYLLMPFAVTFDIVTFPIQAMTLSYMFA